MRRPISDPPFAAAPPPGGDDPLSPDDPLLAADPLLGDDTHHLTRPAWRPPPSIAWRERVEGWVALVHAVGVMRVVAGVLTALGAVALGWWLLQPPPTPIEDTLPMMTVAPVASPSNTPITGVGAAGDIVVHVAGAVRRPGVYRFVPGERVADAVDRAGGAGRRADLDRVNLAALLIDGQQIMVPRVGEPLPLTGAGATGAPSGPININTADIALLDALPGVGPATAAAIVAHRDEHGPFVSVDELLDVPGIGPAKLAALRDLVTS
jgi:competence protein ComEA